MVKFAILGPVELHAADRRLPIGGPRQLGLLAFLLLHANHAVSRDHLYEALWREQGPIGASKRVQMAIARLRKSLKPLDRRLDGRAVLRTVSGGYLLAVSAGELDADVFQDAVSEGRALLDSGDPAGASEALCAALGLWRGPALSEFAFEDFARSQIRRLEELRLVAIEARLEADLALGRHRAVIGELQALIVEHPEREGFCQQLMLALYRCGRQYDALEVYQRLRTHLVGELGLHPGPALQSLQRAILEQSSSLNLDAERSGTPYLRIGDGAQRQPTQQTAQHAFALPPALRGRDDGALVGRAATMERLGRYYNKASGGSRQIVLLCGEPGVGKTRLAAEFARQAHDERAIVLHGRCDEEPLLPHQPVIEALRHYICTCAPELLAGQLQLVSGELRRVVPELAERVPGLAQPLTGDVEGARYRLFEAVTALLCEAAQQRPLVLVLDDLHWADKATLLLLRHMARYPRGAKLMVLATYRETELVPDHPLTGVLSDLVRERLCERLAVARLDEAAVCDLVRWHTGGWASVELQRAVFAETKGNPFFAVEILRHLAESGAISGERERETATLAPWRLPLPAGIRDLVGRRVARLGAQTNRVLEAASVVGQVFGVELLQRLCDLDEDELVDTLERAVRAQIIEESAGYAGQYTFSHNLIRDVLYEMPTAARRALLHRRVAVSIEDARSDDLEPHLAELAYHYARAGAKALDKAIAYSALAGELAVALLAYEQAAAHYRDAIGLLDRSDVRGRGYERCDLIIAQGVAERKAGDSAYRRTLLEAARIAQELGDVQRLAHAALANNRGALSSSQGVDHERVVVLETALQMLDAGDSATRARLLAQLGLELSASADWRRPTQLSDSALAMARRVGDPRTLGRVLTMRAVAQWNPRTLHNRNADLLEASRLADRLGERLLAAQAAYLGCDAALEAGDLGRADRLLETLGTLVQQFGQPMIAWYDAIARAKRCAIVSSPKDAERLAFAAHDIGRRAGQPDAIIWFFGQIFVAQFLQGTLNDGQPNLPKLFEQPGSSPIVGSEFTPSRSIPMALAATMSAVFCEVGRVEAARRHFEPLMAELSDLPLDYTTMTILAGAAIACAHLNDAPRAERLYTLLKPYSEHFVNTGASWFGAVTHHLALLCATTNRREEADARFAAAERAYERLGAHAWLARCRMDWAASLLADETHRDPGPTCGLLDRALATARELGLSAIEERVMTLQRRP